MERPSFADLSPEQLAYVLQFQHPERILRNMPGLDDAVCGQIFGLDTALYRQTRASFADNASRAAAALLAEPEFAAQVDRLPFRPGATVVGLGDSITDDDQSWLEILRHLLAQRRPADGIRVINAGVSGDTTAQMIARFLEIVWLEPDWVICFAGTNDARRHGLSPTKTLVSLEETAKNYAMLRNFAATQTAAQWVWMTPATVIEEAIVADWFLGPMQLSWRNEDLLAIGDVLRAFPEPVVDLQALFGVPANPELLLSDGLHPSLTGQVAIIQALLERVCSG